MFHRLTTFICAFLLLAGVSSVTYLGAQPREYANSSVLSSGTWYKVGIKEDGIYRLDADFFNQLGINIGSVNPANIQLYGNGGAMLPQANDATRHDDLVENAIWVEGADDGSFDQNDYVLFYGQSPHTWSYNDQVSRFEHTFNLYSDTTYYFLQIADQPGLRVQEAASPINPVLSLGTAVGVDYVETDNDNPIKSGRYWLGDKFDLITEKEYAFDMPDLAPDGEIRVTIRVTGRSSSSTRFYADVGERRLGTMSINRTRTDDNDAIYYYPKVASYTVQASELADNILSLKLLYDKGGNSRSEGWLDWIEINYDKELDAQNGSSYSFSIPASTNPATVASLSVANANGFRFWDVSNPLQPEEVNLQSGSFNTTLDIARTYRGFTNDFLTPVSGRQIPNQNLHGLELADYLIISAPSLTSEAERLANFHRSQFGRVVHVVSPGIIYNEFSSGKQDVTAVRDFIKMFYDLSGGSLPGHVLMLGDGSYDFKGVLKDIDGNSIATGILPTYQSRNSWSPTQSYTSDDFFVFLDDEEGFWGERSNIAGDRTVEENFMDAGIGRIPAATLEQAKAVVDKIISYVTDMENAGDWRNRVVLVADHKEGEGDIHVSQADGYTEEIEKVNACYNVDKIYMDNYTFVPTPTQPTFPDGRDALLDELDKGSLIVNYTGHGGEFAWSNSRILEISDIPQIRNGMKLPAVVTATCEFGRWDDPGLRSGAELMLEKADGGAISLFTTVRLVFSNPNQTLNENFYKEVFTFDEDKDRMPTMGEVMQATKNRTFQLGDFTNINSRNFTLLGDPAIQLSYPTYRANIQTINDLPLSADRDTLKSLSLVSLEGTINDLQGNLIENYTGELDVTVFDKPSRFTTRLSDFSFDWRKNRIFSGKATVENGNFQVSFKVPLDISYDDGTGKISLYFSNLEVDGAGCYNNVFIGGTDTNAPTDDEGPAIELFLNDKNWQEGGITDSNPILLVDVSDESGINTVGSGIGHELIGILDGDNSNPIILNDFYSAAKDDFTRGSVDYRLRELEEGTHNILVRVWDGANNPSEAITTFIVVSDENMALNQVLNYPNPAILGEETVFKIGHNQAGKNLIAEIEVFDTQGRSVRLLSAEFTASGNNFEGIRWDGANSAGSQLSPGIYVYTVSLTDRESGNEVNSYNRMVWIRQ
ncbi:MAG: type IX secretion system sortase PorU, partial [Bacteroidota bacterium]